jgi:hypothetical protein
MSKARSSTAASDAGMSTAITRQTYPMRAKAEAANTAHTPYLRPITSPDNAALKSIHPIQDSKPDNHADTKSIGDPMQTELQTFTHIRFA